MCHVSESHHELPGNTEKSYLHLKIKIIPLGLGLSFMSTFFTDQNVWPKSIHTDLGQMDPTGSWVVLLLAEGFHSQKVVDPVFLGFLQRFKWDNWLQNSFYWLG